MSTSLSKEAKAIIDAAVASGQYASPEAVIEAGLKLLAEREGKLNWLRAKIRKSIEVGGSHTDEEVGEYLDRVLEETERKLEQTERPQAAK